MFFIVFCFPFFFVFCCFASRDEGGTSKDRLYISAHICVGTLGPNKLGVAFFGLLYIVLFLFLCVFCFEGSDLNYYFYFFDLGDLRILFYPKMLL